MKDFTKRVIKKVDDEKRKQKALEGFTVLNLPSSSIEKKILAKYEVWNFPPLKTFKGKIMDCGSMSFKDKQKTIVSRYGIRNKKWRVNDGFVYYYTSSYTPNNCDYLKVFVFTDFKKNVKKEIWVF